VSRPSAGRDRSADAGGAGSRGGGGGAGGGATGCGGGGGDGAGSLALLNLAVGEAVRWRERPGGRWQHGSVSRRERDGSVGVTEAGGAARSLTVDRLEVACRGTRGARTWEALAVRAARCEQLSLLPLLDGR
jgi:hypothetical protein